MAAWLRSDLKEYACDVLSPRRLGGGSLFDSAFVGKALDDHAGGRSRHNKLLFSLLMFQTWWEREMA
jgi:asparagine synthase (glutamine-hydrolysing)